MNFEEALKEVEKGHCVTREGWREGRRFMAKIVPFKKKGRKKGYSTYLWERTAIACVFKWTPLEDPRKEMLEENRAATDWRRCSPPS